VLLIRWLLVIIDYVDSATLDKLRRLYTLLFLLLDNTLLVDSFLMHSIIYYGVNV